MSKWCAHDVRRNRSRPFFFLAFCTEFSLLFWGFGQCVFRCLVVWFCCCPEPPCRKGAASSTIGRRSCGLVCGAFLWRVLRCASALVLLANESELLQLLRCDEGDQFVRSGTRVSACERATEGPFQKKKTDYGRAEWREARRAKRLAASIFGMRKKNHPHKTTVRKEVLVSERESRNGSECSGTLSTHQVHRGKKNTPNLRFLFVTCGVA